MSSIRSWSDVLNEHMVDAWPRVAEVLSGIDCALMGGTGMAMLLRHRESYDLDFVTLEPFDSRGVAARFLASARYAAYKEDDRDHIAKVAFDGVPVTVMRDLRGLVKGHAKDVSQGVWVDGVRIGSLPDLMAMKLDVVQDRRQVRDYIDIFEMDRSGACRIEDGLRYHRQRYEPTVSWEETTAVADLVTHPPAMSLDPVFDERMPEVADYLSGRRDEVMRWAIQSAERPRGSPPPPPEALDAPPDPFPTRGMDLQEFRAPTVGSADVGTSGHEARCGKWMPVAEAHCTRPSGHNGSCRSGGSDSG